MANVLRVVDEGEIAVYDIQSEDEWQVRDREGVIFDGDEYEMASAFLAIATDDESSEYYVETWYPPLQLIHVTKSAW